jgi:hypothetical protein
MVTGPEGRRRAATRAASASVGNGNASFSGPHVAVGNLRVSQTECPPGYATRITNIAKPPPVSQRCKPADLGLEPDGGSGSEIKPETRFRERMEISIDWTLGRALRTRGFWWLAASYFCGLFTWYAVVGTAVVRGFAQGY